MNLSLRFFLSWKQGPRLTSMKRVTWALSLALCLSSLPALAATPPKPGASCTKQGSIEEYKGKKYTCIKKKKKLLWNKGVAIKTAVPAGEPTPTPIPYPSPSTDLQSKQVFLPWSTIFSVEVMREKAYESFSSWVKNQSSSPVNHQILLQSSSGGYSPTIIEVFKELDNLSSRVFSQFMKKKSVTVIGLDQPWVISQILSSGGHLRNSQGRCDEPYGSYTICMNRDSHFGLVVLNDCPLPKGSVSGCNLTLLPHEYFHLVQINLADNIEGAHWNYGEDYAKNSFPHWLVEGSANFVASAIVANARNSKYEATRRCCYSIMANALVDYEVVTSNQEWDDIRSSSYDMGHIATEYIVASIGFQKFLDIWKDFSNTRNFYTSFERVTGRSVSNLYADFESARESLRVPPVTRKRN